MKITHEANWQKSSTLVFWGEVAPSDHLVQIYDNEEVILDSLEGFVNSGLVAGDSIILIATKEHLASLDQRLVRYGFDIAALRTADRYITLDAEELLSKFMVNGWPDETLFF